MKNKELWKKIVLIISILALLGVLGYFFYNEYLKLSPQKVFNTAISSTITKFQETIGDEAVESQEGTLSLETDITTTDPEFADILNVINNLKISLNYGVDYKNNFAYYDIEIDYKKEDLINIKSYIENQKASIYLKDIYPKYIAFDAENYVEDYQTYSNTYEQVDPLTVVSNELEKAIKNSLKEEYFQNTKETVTINNEELELDKSTLILDNKNISAIYLSILNELKDNENFIKNFALLAEQTETDLLLEINEIIKDLKDSPPNILSTNENVEINIYTKGLKRKFIMLEGITDQEHQTKTRIIKDSNQKYQFSLEGENNLSGTIEKKENSYKINVIYNESKINLTIGYTLERNVEIKQTKINNTIDYDDLTDQEMMEILGSLFKQENIVTFVEDLGIF